jgi:hypothetical protein
MKDWFELQEKAKIHDSQMKELVTSHVEDQQRSVPVETDTGKWGPQKMGPDKQVSRTHQAIMVQLTHPRRKMGQESKTRLQPWIC